jgi:hypothetical protein
LKRITIAGLLGCALLAACDGKSGADGGSTVDPIPADATLIPMGARYTADRVLLGAVDRATFVRDSTGKLFLQAFASRYQLEQNCSDFGCIWGWVQKPLELCFEVNGETATESGGCGAVPLFDESGLAFSAPFLGNSLDIFSGVAKPEVSHEEGISVETAGKRIAIGGATIKASERDEFGDWVDEKTIRTTKVGVVTVFEPDGGSGRPHIFPTPDGTDLIPDLMAFVDDGARKLYWRTRDDAVFSFKPTLDSIPRGRFLDNGVFGYQVPYLGRYEYKAGGRVIAVAEVDGEVVMAIATWSHEGTVNHGEGLGGGLLTNLWLRKRPAKSSDELPITPFLPYGASTGSPYTVDVCFNRQLSAASVTPDKFTFDDGAHPASAKLLPGNQCVMLGVSPMDPDSHPNVVIAGVVAADGELFMPGGVSASFQPERVEPFDYLYRLFKLTPESKETLPLGGTIPAGGRLKWHALPNGEILHSTASTATTAFGVGLVPANWRSFIPLSDRVGSGFSELLGPDLSGQGVWFRENFGSALIRYDGTTSERYSVADHPGLDLGSQGYLTLIGNGAVLTRQGANFVLLKGGQVTPFPGLTNGGFPILNSTDVLETVQTGGGQYDRRSPDGTSKGIFTIPGIAGTMTAFDVGAQTFICAYSGLYKGTAGATLTKLTNACGTASLGMPGEVWIGLTPEGDVEWRNGYMTVNLSDGSTRAFNRADPVYGRARGGLLTKPRLVGDLVYAYRTAPPGSPATLVSMPKAVWDALPAEANP